MAKKLRLRLKKFLSSKYSWGKGCDLIMSREIIRNYLPKFSEFLENLGWVKITEKDRYWTDVFWCHPKYPHITTKVHDLDLWQCGAGVAYLSAHISGMFFLPNTHCDFLAGGDRMFMMSPIILNVTKNAIKTRNKMRNALREFKKDAIRLTNASEAYVSARRLIGNLINNASLELDSIVGTTSFWWRNWKSHSHSTSKTVSPNEIKFFKNGENTLTFKIEDDSKVSIITGKELVGQWDMNRFSIEQVEEAIKHRSEGIAVKKLTEAKYISADYVKDSMDICPTNFLVPEGKLGYFSIVEKHLKDIETRDNFDLMLESLDKYKKMVNPTIWESIHSILIENEKKLRENPYFKFSYLVPYCGKLVLMYFHSDLSKFEDDRGENFKSISGLIHFGTNDYKYAIKAEDGSKGNFLRGPVGTTPRDVRESFSTIFMNFLEIIKQCPVKLDPDKWGAWEERFTSEVKFDEKLNREVSHAKRILKITFKH